MIRSALSISRLLLLPYVGLLLLYLLVVGGGGAWLYIEARNTQSRILVEEIMGELRPLVARFSAAEMAAVMDAGGSWFQTDVTALFNALPALREVSVRDIQQGYRINRDTSGTMTTEVATPLAEDESPVPLRMPIVERLLLDDDSLFVIRFDLAPTGEPPVRLDFAFSRTALLAQVSEAMRALTQAIMLFGVAGGLSILLAMVITFLATRAARRIESHFQEVYRRASVAELAAGLVHDLRNPMMALRANVKALLVTPAAVSEIVSDLERDIASLNEKLNSFLDLTRHSESRFEPVDMKRLIDDAARLAEPTLTERGLQLQVQNTAGLPPVETQSVLLRDALVNLIVNAAQSGQKSGVIRLRAECRDNRLMIHVEDRGEGIPPENLSRIFEPFFTTKADGNGLGLAIVKRIVEAHRGRVEAENRPGGGARTTLIIPIKHQEAPPWWMASHNSSRT